MNQKYEILADALRLIARREHCNCGCPSGSSADPLKVMHAYQIALNALKEVGEFVPVMANKFYDSNTD